MSDDDIRGMMKMMGEVFRDNAPMSAAQAATIILDGVRSGQVAHPRRRRRPRLDEAVRANPEGIYDEGGVNLLSVMQPGS